MNNGAYTIALYIRLSIEDSKVESMSIENQKIVLHRCADELEGSRSPKCFSLRFQRISSQFSLYAEQQEQNR